MAEKCPKCGAAKYRTNPYGDELYACDSFSRSDGSFVQESTCKILQLRAAGQRLAEAADAMLRTKEFTPESLGEYFTLLDAALAHWREVTKETGDG